MAELDPEELLEEALKKTGPELFKEVYRLYPAAEYEDYYKNGSWKNDMMKTDVVLFSRHREEAGAPCAKPIEEIKISGLPGEAPKAWNTTITPMLGQLGQIAKIPGAQTPQGTATAANVPGGTVAELRLIALFVAKWKLDPTRTKSCLAKMTPERRRFVVTNFKTDKAGIQATDDLDKYVETCEKDGSWDQGKPADPKANAVGTSPAAGFGPAAKIVLAKPAVAAFKPGVNLGKAPGTVVTPLSVGGVKRPWGATGATNDGNAAKWPKTATPTLRPPSLGVRPQGAAATGAGWGGVRPPQVVSAKRPAAPALVRPQIAWNGKGAGKGW